MEIKKYHKTNIRIYYEDTDAGGIVYHSKYLNFAERARTEFLRKCRLNQFMIKQKYGLIFIVSKLSINYKSFACLDDKLLIKTYISKLNKVKVVFTQLIYKNKNLIAKLEVVCCCLNNNRKVARINDQIYDSLIKQEGQAYE